MNLLNLNLGHSKLSNLSYLEHKMIIKYIFIALLCFSVSAKADTFAIKIKEYGITDFSVKFKDYGIADETWKITGSCTSAFNYSTIKIKEYGITDKTVKVKTSGIADKEVCIKNPEDIPDWLAKMLN